VEGVLYSNIERDAHALHEAGTLGGEVHWPVAVLQKDALDGVGVQLVAVEGQIQRREKQ
jgi:hypothetical protein